MQNHSVWSRFQVPFFFFPLSPRSPSCTRAWKCYQAFPLLWNPSFVHANDSKGRNCSWKLQIFIHFFAAYLEGFRIPPASRAHPVYDCKNRMWKFMEDVEDENDDVWLKVVQSVSFFFFLFFFLLMRRFFWHWSFENLVFIEISL